MTAVECKPDQGKRPLPHHRQGEEHRREAGDLKRLSAET